jgi:hypothetical protein
VSGTGSGERDAEIVREHERFMWSRDATIAEKRASAHEFDAALVRLLADNARLTEERDGYRFHFDQQEERAEATEKANRALGARNSELLAKLARLERIEEAARDVAIYKPNKGGQWERAQKRLNEALAAEEGGDRECLHPDHSFDRSICACGSMHYYCVDCGAQVDDCAGEFRLTPGQRKTLQEGGDREAR